MANKTQKVLKHLQSGKTITGIQAMNKFNLMSLAQQIAKLRRRGYNIITEMVETKESIHAKYSLK